MRKRLINSLAGFGFRITFVLFFGCWVMNSSSTLFMETVCSPDTFSNSLNIPYTAQQPRRYSRNHHFLFYWGLGKMEAVCFFETLPSTYQSTQRYNPEDHHRHLHRRCENLSFRVTSTPAYVTTDRYFVSLSIPVVARSKVQVCGRLVAGIAGSNPAEGTDVCPCVYMLCCPV
jgi:hypothetical protein